GPDRAAPASCGVATAEDTSFPPRRPVFESGFRHLRLHEPLRAPRARPGASLVGRGARAAPAGLVVLGHTEKRCGFQAGSLRSGCQHGHILERNLEPQKQKPRTF
uniref:Uncharacterized protein n=1 Tax=Mustela putorius furo TaxID=9669 RepID=M3YI87_MUSPF